MTATTAKTDTTAKATDLSAEADSTVNAEETVSAGQGDTALVIGATGFLGGHLLTELRARGYAVRVYARQGHSERLGVGPNSWLTGELSDTASLEQACRGAQVVFHLANLAHAGASQRVALRQVNIEGTAEVCAACLQAGVPRLVYVSSSLASDPAGSAYAASKREAERAVLAAGEQSGGALHVTVLRPVNVYGSGMKGNIAGLIRRIGRRQLPPLPRLTNRIALISAGDVCRAALAAARGSQDSGSIYTLTDGQSYTPNRIEAAVYRALDRKKPDWHTPRVIFYAAAVLAQMAGALRMVNNDLGLRTYRNLVRDQGSIGTGAVPEIKFTPGQTLESEIEETVRSLL